MIAWLQRLNRGHTAAARVERAAKPRVRIRADGWIRHVPSPFPFSPKMLVEVMMANGDVIGNHLCDYAGSYREAQWCGRAPNRANNIRFYRIVGEPPQ